jgi:sensor histidine kinase YesM
MKRLIILLLVLSCFRFSQAQELTAEQQQLAWKFIYGNMLANDYLPTIFKKDIIINLKGEINSSDSTIVKDLIKDFQKAIPHLKIELSDKPGNLILGLNDGKENGVAITTDEINNIKSIRIKFPANLTDSERKEFIYFNLFKGLTSYKHQMQPFDGLNGCIFAENDFKTITFSPYDLFILEKLYAPDFSIQLARNLPIELQQTAWNILRSKFMYGGQVDPTIYKNDIAIKLEGDVHPIDSVCIKELVISLRSVIPNRKIFITKENANLVFTFFSTLPVIGTSTNVVGSEIKFTGSEVYFSINKSKEDRKRVLYQYLCNSLIRYQQSFGYAIKIRGCVFDEENPENVRYHPIDIFILNKLYSDDFQKQFRENFIAEFSYRSYLTTRYSSQLNLIFSITALLVSMLLLFYLLWKGVFSQQSVSAEEYFKQGLYLILIAATYVFIRSCWKLVFTFNEMQPVLQIILRGFLLISLTFIFERILLKNVINGSTRIVQIFLVTLICWLIVSIPYTPNYSRNLIYALIFAGSFVRCMFIFIIEWHLNILTKKDVELAQMGKFQKQAELQSLRAKINPHFLYNALNSIASLATTDARKTEQMALALSDFFKYAINREQKQLNTLSEELGAIRTYLEIEKVRFGDRLSFEIDCPEELLDIQIPQLLIQPLVENAIKHGLSQITENGLIRISVSRAENQLKIRVYDNGPAFPDGPLSGFGIQNTQERIALLYGAKATINWQNGAEKYVEISIPV